MEREINKIFELIELVFAGVESGWSIRLQMNSLQFWKLNVDLYDFESFDTLNFNWILNFK